MIFCQKVEEAFRERRQLYAYYHCLDLWPCQDQEKNGTFHSINPKGKPGDLGLKFHSKDYLQKLTYNNTVAHPSTNRGRCCLTPLYQAADHSSMPITTVGSSYSKQRYVYLKTLISCSYANKSTCILVNQYNNAVYPNCTVVAATFKFRSLQILTT